MAQNQTMDEGRIKKQEARERRQLNRWKDNLGQIMSFPQGREFMYELIFDRCGLQDTYPAQDSGIYRNEGRREVGFNLARDLQLNHPEAYTTMISERLERAKILQRARREDEIAAETKGDEE